MWTIRRCALPAGAVAIAAAACGVGGSAHVRDVPSIEELTLVSRGARLGATLHLPAAREPCPAVVVIHGSGRLSAADVSRVVAPRMNAMGFAVLAYDKRGIGRSEGEYTGIGPRNSVAMFDLLADDALAGVRALKQRRDIDGSRIGLFGFSQAGWIAPLAASRSSDVRYVVLISGPAVTVGEENAYSDLAGADPGSRQGLSDAEIERGFAAFKGPHGFDPDAAIRGMRVPSLWVLGDEDRSIPVKRSVANLERIRKDTGHPITITLIPGVDHGMRNRVTGQAADLWAIVTAWLRKENVVRN